MASYLLMVYVLMAGDRRSVRLWVTTKEILLLSDALSRETERALDLPSPTGYLLGLFADRGGGSGVISDIVYAKGCRSRRQSKLTIKKTEISA